MAIRWFLPDLVFALSLALYGVFTAGAAVPAVFIFGDSTADVGTNTHLPDCKARSDFPHNGIDFPRSRPTGRFSNGLNSADFLAKLFGFRRSPPSYLSLANRTRLLDIYMSRGINFASGGSGILGSTGRLEKVMTLGEQVEQLGLVKSQLEEKMGEDSAAEFLAQSIFFVSTGSNDLFAYHYSNRSLPKDDFILNLGLAYEDHLKNLISIGARKFGIIGVAPIGCCPSQRAQSATGGCLEDLNDSAQAFYSNIDSTLQRLSSDYPGLKYSLGNAYEMTINVINNPTLAGFSEVKTACCGAGAFNGQGVCDRKANLCSDRNNHLFWDMYHPTQAASKVAAATLYGGGAPFTTPINFSQLAMDN
uniref:GDSL esterase/lipase n=1 Tax=Kalanchoe fedtschenkoi TaxID=63787 RepID=A0A7N0ZR82_KALFE